MNKVEIEKIALEVAKEVTPEFVWEEGCSHECGVCKHEPYEFATRFLARIDAERGKEAVAWMSPGKERIEFSRADTVYGSHTLPLFLSPTIPEGMALVPIEPTDAVLKAESERQDGLSLTDATQRIAELKSESIEQCRIIGMSSEREARHLAAISELERECNGLAARIGKELNVENEALKVSVSEQAALIEKCEKALDTTIVNAPDPYCAITRRVRAIQDEALAAIAAQKGGAA